MPVRRRLTTPNTLIVLMSAAITVLATTSAFADEDLDVFPGLLGTYSNDDASVQRIDRTLAFDWGTGAPDERLPVGRFTAEWTGNLLVRLPGVHRFHASVAGDVIIKIDGETVLNAPNASGFVSGDPIELRGGDHDITVSYSTPTRPDKTLANLAVFWSSDAFTLEPLPADVLSRDDPSPQVSHAEQGRGLMDAHRCSACHRSESTLPTLAAPALDHVAVSHNLDTLVERIWKPQNVVTNSHMPNFGLTVEEAESVAAYLKFTSHEAPLKQNVTFKDGDVDVGRKLLISMGCVSCHDVPGGLTTSTTLATPYDAPELISVHRRRSVAWIDRWLKDPKSLNSDHRMPVFDLSNDERRQLVAALSKPSEHASPSPKFQRQPPKSNEDAMAAGRRIIEEANCAACHRIPGIEAKTVTPLTDESLRAPRGDCLHPANTPHRRSKAGTRVPSFVSFAAADNQQRHSALTNTDAQKLKAWISSITRSTSPVSPAAYGKLLLNRNGCTACHDRNQQQGLSSIASKLQKLHPDLNGQSQGLVPPSLTAVGDKLNDDYLRTAVAGAQKERRLPWLHVRMPRFNHSKADHAAILKHLITTDRIPDEADGVRQDILAHIDVSADSDATTNELLIGNQLAGAAGFNCVACHKAGAFEPRNVALGTRGSDIMTMGDRLRPRFFQRWMKNPIRVVAGIEMPAIKRGVPGILNDSLPAQLGVLWKALSDERFTPPTVTSRFEQVVNGEPGGPPKIIRDVFTIGTGKDRDAVARAMAIGFGNGHNILIDLNTMRVRLWTFGEFARQRTEGKSWYWDMPGLMIRRTSTTTPPFGLDAQQTMLPLEDEGRFAELLSYRVLPKGVEVTVAWHFHDATNVDVINTVKKDQQNPHFAEPAWQKLASDLTRVVSVHRFEEHISDEDSSTGWKHSITLQDAPSDSVLRGPLVIYGDDQQFASDITVETSPSPPGVKAGETMQATQTISATTVALRNPPNKPPIVATAAKLSSTPGFDGRRLPLDSSIMPTAMAWLPDNRLAFTSLKGHVWIAEDTNGDTLPDTMEVFESGLAAPFGLLSNDDGSLIVAHKPEVLHLNDQDGDGRADHRNVIASGWGFNDNYHDWTSGLVRDNDGNMYVGLGSDYSQKKRPANQDRWRGGVIRISPDGMITPLGMSMRYPMGLAIDRQGNLFATDNQGVQNTFNEINHIIEGKHYGVPSIHQPTENLQHESPALMVPHPWTRSVNSILFLPDDFPVAALRGHGIGCEYDSRFLIRFTVQDVNGTLQGASYRFSLPNQEAGGSNFIGPICSAVSPNGELYIGSIWDSGWQGGPNTGGIERLVPSPKGLPNGIREVTATANGFDVEFFQPVSEDAAANMASWSLQAYTRKWGGGYATPDSGRHTVTPSAVNVSDGGRRVRLTVSDLRAGYVYDISISGPLAKSEKLWPSEAHYSMKVVPAP